MINTLDLQECEVLLPGDWTREGSGEVYSFRPGHILQLQDRQLPYVLDINGDYCSIRVGNEEFDILRIINETDGTATMEWQNAAGLTLSFQRTANRA